MASPITQSKILGLVGRVLNVTPAALTPDASPDTVEAWDSLRHMNLVMALEEELGVSFSEEEVLSMLSIQSILDTLGSKLTIQAE